MQNIVIFDGAGVFLRSYMQRSFDAIAKECQDAGQSISAEKVRSAFLNEPKVFNQSLGIEEPLMKALDRGEISVSAFFSSIRDEIKYPYSVEKLVSHWCHALEPIQSTIDLIRDLKKAGNVVAILSNVNQAHVDFINSHFGLYDHVPTEFQILSCQVGFTKPMQEIYQLAERKLNVQRDSEGKLVDRVCFVDDQEKNHLFPSKLGWDKVLVKWSGENFEDPQAKMETDIQKTLKDLGYPVDIKNDFRTSINETSFTLGNSGSNILPQKHHEF